MICGVCGTGTLTGFPVLNLATDVNPLGGAPLASGQILVRGPSNTQCTQPDGTTGPRTTVVSPALRASWPAWITADASGRPVDTGTIPGGCWQGQQLPDLLATAGQFPWWLLLLIIALYLLTRRHK